MYIDSKIRVVRIAFAHLLIDGVLLILGAAHAHLNAVRGQIIAARQRHREVCFLFDDAADCTAVAAAMADTDKYLLAHLVLLLRNSCLVFTLNANYAAHRPAVRTLFFRREQVAVRHAIHASAAACVLYEQQLDVVVIADVLRNFQLGVTGRSLHMDIPAVCQQAAHITAAPVRLAERSVHLAVLDRQLPTRNNIL